jgi:hypothetical protein
MMEITFFDSQTPFISKKIKRCYIFFLISYNIFYFINAWKNQKIHQLFIQFINYVW